MKDAVDGDFARVLEKIRSTGFERLLSIYESKEEVLAALEGGG